MKFFGSKFFLTGVLFLLLLSIPLTIYFIRQQQRATTEAAPSSILTFTPTQKTINKGEEFTVDININPQQN